MSILLQVKVCIQSPPLYALYYPLLFLHAELYKLKLQSSSTLNY